MLSNVHCTQYCIYSSSIRKKKTQYGDNNFVSDELKEKALKEKILHVYRYKGRDVYQLMLNFLGLKNVRFLQLKETVSRSKNLQT